MTYYIFGYIATANKNGKAKGCIKFLSSFLYDTDIDTINISACITSNNALKIIKTCEKQY